MNRVNVFPLKVKIELKNMKKDSLNQWNKLT